MSASGIGHRSTRTLHFTATATATDGPFASGRHSAASSGATFPAATSFEVGCPWLRGQPAAWQGWSASRSP